MNPLYLDKENLTIDDLVSVARSGRDVAVSSFGEARVARTSA
ncbi:hypothetical protein [Desulfosarcina cetonica]|nr:hypothetical protein [Desulfosarcina cetonica]